MLGQPRETPLGGEGFRERRDPLSAFNKCWHSRHENHSSGGTGAGVEERSRVAIGCCTGGWSQLGCSGIPKATSIPGWLGLTDRASDLLLWVTIQNAMLALALSMCATEIKEKEKEMLRNENSKRGVCCTLHR